MLFEPMSADMILSCDDDVIDIDMQAYIHMWSVKNTWRRWSNLHHIWSAIFMEYNAKCPQPSIEILVKLI